MSVLDRDVFPNSGSLLADLHQAHERVVCAMQELVRVMRMHVPNRQSIANARWKLSKASLERRMLWGRILEHLLPTAGAGTTIEIRRLQERDVELLRASTAHFHKWTMSAIASDWQGYCGASQEITRKMTAQMTEEKRVLYPILRTFGAAQRQPAKAHNLESARRQPLAA